MEQIRVKSDTLKEEIGNRVSMQNLLKEII
jgi:hypothetical protein